MKTKRRRLGWILAGCSLAAMASCMSVEPARGVVALTQEAMAASARLAESDQARSGQGPRAEQAVEAVATWRGAGEGGDTQGSPPAQTP